MTKTGKVESHGEGDGVMRVSKNEKFMESSKRPRIE